MSNEFRPITDSTIYAQSWRKEGLPFLVAAMFTDSVSKFADRLKNSLEKIGLNYVLFEVPCVHSSISYKGTKDVAFSKPNFIHFVQDKYRLPVLYVDADMVFREMPHQVFQFAQERIDFAAYNWLADLLTDAYIPIPLTINGTQCKNRFYRFSHSIDLYDPTQLMVSGCSQYYSLDAEHLLRKWLEGIDAFPDVADDELLDFAYNFSINKNSIKTFWWTKEYSRYAWWITVRPIIDHPQFPVIARTRDFFSVTGKQRFTPQYTQTLCPRGPFRRDCLIDTKEKKLVRFSQQTGPIVIGRFDSELWIVNDMDQQ